MASLPDLELVSSASNRCMTAIVILSKGYALGCGFSNNREGNFSQLKVNIKGVSIKGVRAIFQWRPHPVYLALGETADNRTSAYREIFKGHLDDELITKIRDATSHGMALGSELSSRT